MNRVPSFLTTLRLQICFLFALALLLPGVAHAQSPDDAASTAPLVYVLPIDGEFENALHLIVVRGLREAASHGADAIVLDMNTPGGRVDSAIRIRDELIRTDVPTYAFVNPMALSAGAFIALACDTIVMGPNGSIGAAAIIEIGTEGARDTDEKMQSAWNAEMRKTAKTKGHDPLLAEGFSNPDVEIPGLKEAGEILTLDYDQATSVGLAAFQVPSIEALLQHEGLGGARVVRLEQTRTDRVARWLSSSAVLGILMLVGMGGILLEIKTPGVGLPGAIGAGALLLAFFGSYLANLSSYIEWVLFVVGVGLLLVEIYILPGFGVAGIAGIMLMVGSLVFMLVNLSPDGGVMDIFTGVRFQMLSNAALTILLVLLGLVPLGWLISLVLPSTPFYGQLVLQPTGGGESPAAASVGEAPVAVGARGVTVTPCYPTGLAEFDDERLDVTAEGAFLEKGTPIVVRRIEGRIVYVEPESLA